MKDQIELFVKMATAANKTAVAANQEIDSRLSECLKNIRACGRIERGEQGER